MIMDRRKKKLTRSSALRHVIMLLVLLFSYLIQVSVMPYVVIGGVTPSLLFITVAVITVGFGKLRAFWAGAFFGILLEVMQPTVKLLNLMLYPVSALLCSLLFADKTPQQLEYARSMGRSGRNVTPMLRTPLCAALNTMVYEGVNIVYIYLRGTSINGTHIGRGILNVVMTTLLCCLLMIPLRRLLGLRVTRPNVPRPEQYKAP